MNLRHILTEPLAYLPPAAVLAGLDPQLAERRLEGAPHSIAELVAHMNFWQEWFHATLTGAPTPMPAHATGGWPAVTPGSWPALEARFNEYREKIADLAEADPSAALAVGGPLTGYTAGDAIVHVAIHHAHHLGQVVLLRQMMGAWPPPAGSWTW